MLHHLMLTFRSFLPQAIIIPPPFLPTLCVSVCVASVSSLPDWLDALAHVKENTVDDGRVLHPMCGDWPMIWGWPAPVDPALH